MKFEFDTQKSEDIKLVLTEEPDGISREDAIQDFFFGITSFVTLFCKKLSMDSSVVMSFWDLCHKCVGNELESFLESGVYDSDEEELDEEELDDEAIAVAKEMEKNGFTEEEIDAIVKLVKASGGVESTLAQLLGDIDTIDGSADESDS